MRPNFTSGECRSSLGSRSLDWLARPLAASDRPA